MAVGSELVERLEAICGSEHVFTHAHQLRTYESDGLLHYAVTPGAVALPGDAAQVAAVVRACYEHATPFVARGAGSGLSGGALPVADGIVIGLSRLRRVLEVDLDNGACGGGARGDQHGGLAGGRSRLLLSARPQQPDRVHDRRQHRRELGRRPLPQVRLHDQLRARARGRALRRDGGRGRRPAGRSARLRPARRARRLRGDAGCRHQGHPARRAQAGDGTHARRLLRPRPLSPARPSRPSPGRGWCRARSR